VLHPVHTASNAADRRPAASARYDGDSGRFSVLARTVVTPATAIKKTRNVLKTLI